MELNIITLLYLFFRLAPFIIVCYLSLSSIFSQDMKGLIYLVGLLFACFAVFIIGETIPISYTNGESVDGVTKTVNAVCNVITLGKVGSFSKLPLGIAILTFTFLYLLYIIISNNIAVSNIPTIIFLSLLILGDFIWNIKNNCYTFFGVFMGATIGAAMGWIWGMIVNGFNQPQLFFLNIGGGQSVCSRPSKQLFKCSFPASVVAATA